MKRDFTPDANIHYYDGRLFPLSVRHRPPEERNILLEWLKAKLSSSLAISFLTIIQGSIGSQANYHDGYLADEIAADIAVALALREKAGEDISEYLTLLGEQLSDISTGQCPSGRVTRMYQCLMGLKDWEGKKWPK